MEAVAKAKFVRITPKKVAQVLEMISGKDVETAQRLLTFVPKRGARFAEKLLRSAVANAVDIDAKVDVADLYVSEASVGRGVIMKRWLPRAQGRATPLLKRMSHVSVTVATRE